LDAYYTGLAFWYHIPPWQLVQAPLTWVKKLARHLPAHRDTYFLSLQAAMHGCYQPQGVAAEPDDEFERQMAELHRKAEPMLRKLKGRA
jgi:hypothetical protein